MMHSLRRKRGVHQTNYLSASRRQIVLGSYVRGKQVQGGKEKVTFEFLSVFLIKAYATHFECRNT